jgi:hypothetical protein
MGMATSAGGKNERRAIRSFYQSLAELPLHSCRHVLPNWQLESGPFIEGLQKKPHTPCNETPFRAIKRIFE